MKNETEKTMTISMVLTKETTTFPRTTIMKIPTRILTTTQEIINTLMTQTQWEMKSQT